MNTPLVVAERVAAGVAWLDEHEPGWETLMNVLDLEMSVSCRCVLGQVYADDAEHSFYQDGFAYGISAHDIGFETGIALGFDADTRMPDNWEALTAEWRRVIQARLERNQP
jgi:hypothetical protein